jgi:hypothetical protein
MTAKIIIDIKEGPASNYFAALQKLFGGRVINGGLPNWTGWIEAWNDRLQTE